MTQDIKSSVSATKYLFEQGYSNKVVCFIMGIISSKASRINLEQSFSNVAPAPTFTELQQLRYDVISKIYALPKISKEGINEQDTKYIRLLKFLLVEKDLVRIELYPKLKVRQFNLMWSNKDCDFRDFDSTLIGIPQEDFDKVFRIS